jgi:hypothetical protein
MYVATGYGLGSGRGDSLKSPARVKKIQLLQQQMLSKAHTIRSVGFCFAQSIRRQKSSAKL